MRQVYSSSTLLQRDRTALPGSGLKTSGLQGLDSTVPNCILLHCPQGTPCLVPSFCRSHQEKEEDRACEPCFPRMELLAAVARASGIQALVRRISDGRGRLLLAATSPEGRVTKNTGLKSCNLSFAQCSVPACLILVLS